MSGYATGMIAVVVIAAIVIPIALSWYSWLVKR